MPSPGSLLVRVPHFPDPVEMLVARVPDPDSMPDEIVFGSMRLMSERLLASLFTTTEHSTRALLFALSVDCIAFTSPTGIHTGRQDGTVTVSKPHLYFSPWHLERALWRSLGDGDEQELMEARNWYKTLNRNRLMELLHQRDADGKVRARRQGYPRRGRR